jgi:dihydroflavonol-4-reductase
MFVSTEKARRELGFDPSPAEKGLRNAVEWFEANGYE